MQYFDGADTAASNSILFDTVTVGSNTWMIGSPSKTLFNAPYTAPNVLVTDTIQPYSTNDTSVVSFAVVPQQGFFGIVALQWLQKLDYEQGADGGVVEFLGDDGVTWANAFSSPYVYSYYGFEPGNQDTLVDGTIVFSGTDTTWRNIWFCLDLSWMWSVGMDTLHMRFTHLADSVDTAQDGWMIDNVFAAFTFVHTVSGTEQKNYVEFGPNPTTGPLRIDVRKMGGYHVIESIELIDASGRVVQKYGSSPVKFGIDISSHPDGYYQLRVRTNMGEQTGPVLLAR